MYVIQDVYVFRDLVKNGMHNFLKGQSFSSNDEKEALFLFLAKHGIPFNRHEFAMKLENQTGQEDAQQILINEILAAIDNTFAGVYGI